MAAVQGVYEQRRDTRTEEAERGKSRIFREERAFIIKMHERYKIGPVALEKKIERMYGTSLPFLILWRNEQR